MPVKSLAELERQGNCAIATPKGREFLDRVEPFAVPHLAAAGVAQIPDCAWRAMLDGRPLTRSEEALANQAIRRARRRLRELHLNARLREWDPNRNRRDNELDEGDE